MAVYAIGDVQGCIEPLMQLLHDIDFNQDRDRLWFCGDIVNRGPASLETLEFIHSLRDNVVVVLGNHDLHLLATYYHHGKPGRKDTLDDVLASDRVAELLNWLRHRPLIHTDEELGVHMVHAGIHPQWDMAEAKRHAAEVEIMLRSKQHKAFYKHMYGDKPHTWSEKHGRWQRLRYITNILTRMRYLDADLGVHLNAKGAPGTQPDDLVAWFDFPERATAGDRIIFGHWSTLTLAEREYDSVYPLDTGCLWGGHLTAMRIDSEAFEKVTTPCDRLMDPVHED